MKTAVQLHPRTSDRDRLRGQLLGGAPAAVVLGTLGPVAIFDSDAVVAYELRRGRRTRAFVFRTLQVNDTLAASVPGVRPRVRLLFAVHSIGRARLVQRLFAYLDKHGHDPSELPDAFYLRVGGVLGGQLPAHKVLPALFPLLLTARGEKTSLSPAPEDTATIKTERASPKDTAERADTAVAAGPNAFVRLAHRSAQPVPHEPPEDSDA
jgi:hypothetical protein